MMLSSLNYYSKGRIGLRLALLDAPRIEAGTNFHDEVAKIKTICNPYIGCPKSIHNLRGFLENNPVVQPMETSVLDIIVDTTAQGRLLFQTLIAVILDAHSNNRTWNGGFGSDDIRIIKPWESKEMFIMVLKEPVEFDVRARPLQAMANDLRKVGEILISHYKIGGRSPAHFDEFEELLRRMERESVGDKCDMEHLSYHPAIMPSSARRNFLNKLKRTLEPRGSLTDHSVMVQKPTVYDPDDWTNIVKKSEARCTILLDVYWHNNLNQDPAFEYETNAGGLVKFMRNTLEHGRDICGLEQYLAKKFSRFLPSIMLDLLRSEAMGEPGAKEAWKAYKDSKSNE
uniref:Uncharacterized protein n=2 Tax=Avena sativa TaxID=4498 RepID=A0ACD5XZ30_AVESA